MSTHPNAILLAVLTPDDLSRKTYRAILEESGIESDDQLKLGNMHYSVDVMEDDYDENNQITAPERMHDVVHDLPAGTYNLYLHPAGAAQVTDKPTMTGTVADISDAELVCRAVRNLAPKARRQPAWARIKDVFGLGSTYSHQLCRRFGVDPDTGKRAEYAALNPGGSRE